MKTLPYANVLCLNFFYRIVQIFTMSLSKSFIHNKVDFINPLNVPNVRKNN